LVLCGTAGLVLLGCAHREPLVQGFPVSAWVDQVQLEGQPLGANPGLDALVWAGPPAVPELVRWLPDPGRAPRAAYAISVIAFQNPGATEVLNSVPALVLAIQSRDPQLKVFAIQALAAMAAGATNAVPALVDQLKDPDPGVRMCAVEALGRIGTRSPHVIAGLRRCLLDRDDQVKIFAVKALHDLDDFSAAAASILVRLTKSRLVAVRMLAIQTLGTYGVKSPDAVQALKSSLNDEDEGVKALAKSALAAVEQD
jgi:HEAT repeat protein